MELLLAFILAMVLTMALIPPLMRYAGALHVLDTPGGRKAHAAPIPRIGGIAMVAGAALPLALWLEVDRLSLAYLASLLIVVGFGVWDDRADLPPWAKLAGQVLAVAIVVLSGGVEIHSVTFAARHELPELVAAPLTMLFLLGITNAINLSDGLDGLAGGTTFLCCAAIAALSLGSDMAFVTTLAVVVMGSLLGFLRYNTHPASVFMGDGGSQFLGFTVGVLAVLLTQHEALPYSAAMPLLLLGLPILDTLTVMALRIREGRSPFAADRKHLHHRLLALGFDHFEAVAVIYVLQGTLFLLAWWLRFHSDATILATFAAFAAALLALLQVADARGWRWRGLGSFRLGEHVAGEGLLRLKAPERLPYWTALVSIGCVSAYLALVGVGVGAVSHDVGWLAAGLCVVLALASLQPRSDLPGLRFISQGAVYVSVVMAVYLDHFEPELPRAIVRAKFVLFPLLTAAVLVRLRTWRERRFEITTLDLLVVFVALALPNLPGLRGAPSNLGLTAAKLVVLLYAVELLCSHTVKARTWMWRVAAGFLGLVAVRGLVLA